MKQSDHQLIHDSHHAYQQENPLFSHLEYATNQGSDTREEYGSVTQPIVKHWKIIYEKYLCGHFEVKTVPYLVSQLMLLSMMM